MTLIEKWFDRAYYDLGAASDLLKSKRYLYVAFLCQQALEKALKAYFIHQQKDNPPYIHSLPRLAQLCQLSGKISEEHQDLLELINPFYIEARYPEIKVQLNKLCDEEFCQKILVETESLLKWLEQEVK